MFVSKVFQLPGFPDIHALQCGEEQAPIILALHGWLDNAASFFYLAPLLENYRVIAIDLPGHGLSGHFAHADAYLLTHQLRWLHALVSALADEPVVLLGHSMGAAICSLYAACFPEKVRQWVVLDMLGSLTEEVTHFVSRLRQSTEVRCQGGARLLQGSDTDEGQCRGVNGAVYPKISDMVMRRAKMNGLPAKVIAPMVERGVKSCDGGFEWAFDRRLLTPSPVYLSEGQNRALLGNIAQPGLVVMAEHGWAYRSPLFQQRYDCLPSADLVVIPGGHHQHMSHASMVAENINRWLSS